MYKSNLDRSFIAGKFGAIISLYEALVDNYYTSITANKTAFLQDKVAPELLQDCFSSQSHRRNFTKDIFQHPVPPRSFPVHKERPAMSKPEVVIEKVNRQ